MATLSIYPKNELRLLYQHGNPDMCLAVEEAVARCGIPTFRVWTTSKCVVVGRFQTVDDEVDYVFCRKKRIAVLRRFTGGGAVYLDEGVFCLSFCLPLQPNPLDVFRALSSSVAGLVGAEIDEKNSLFVEGKKISGAASCKKWGSLFHHMTLVIECNLENMEALTPHKNRESRIPSTYCEVENLGGNMKVVLFEVAKSFQSEFGISLTHGKLSQEELDLAQRLLKEKYRNEEWNFLGIDPLASE